MSGKEIEQPLSMSPEDIEPGRIKFFGVCQIVFGSLGLMNVAYGIVMQFLREPCSGSLKPEGRTGYRKSRT